MEATNNKEEEEGNKTTTRLEFIAKSFKEGFKGMEMRTWVGRLQLTFLERFLGEEAFAEHVKVNKQLQRMFKVDNNVKVAATEKQVMEADREDVKTRFYKPKHKCMFVDSSHYFTETKGRQIHRKLTNSPSSWWSKVETQHRKHQRIIASIYPCKNVWQYSDCHLY